MPRRATLWDDLKTLFGVIYEGSDALGVPAYNGGLFNPAKHPFLEERAIGDRYLAQAIDLLARAEAGGGQGLSFVDYRDLEIRHLGSIYEGLLEYRLRMADDEPGVELATERGERKATGSYYTPDYIVKYIVEQTLGPLADAQAKAVQKEVEALKARNRGAARRTPAYKDELARLQNSFANRIMTLNVLDPAMGSGHFLVEATDYLARRIVEAGVVSEALVNGDEESELSYWRRWVVERCIYGVDLNPLAVELAKLSLWLATVAQGKPLSFLDHHLRCGNSLIGARVADLQALPVRKKGKRDKGKGIGDEAEQLVMWDESAFTQDMFKVVGGMQVIQMMPTEEVKQVEEKQTVYEKTVERERRKWRDIADLWTATYFGLELTPELYNACVQYAQDKPVLLQAAQAEALLTQAHEIWEEKRFFHWEIEFPEVFFDQHGRHKGDAAGFDAVVGNPPYGAVFDTKEKNWVISQYSTVGWRGESYLAFSEACLKWPRQGGIASLIVPDTWLSLKFTEDLRKLFLTEGHLRAIVALPNTVFPDAVVDTSIFVVEIAEAGKRTETQTHVSWYPKTLKISSLDHPASERTVDPRRWLENPYSIISAGVTAQEERMAEKVRIVSLPLSEIANIKYGLKAYQEGKGNPKQTREQVNRKAFTSKVRKTPDFAPFLEGREIYRYENVWDEDNWIWYGPWLAEPRMPELFEGERLLFRKIVGETLVGTYIQEQAYNNTLLYVIKTTAPDYELNYILTLLNSRIVGFYFRIAYAISKEDIFPQIMLDDIAQLPIRRISFATPAEERARLVGVGITEATEWIERTEGAASVSFSAFSASVFGRWLAARLSAEPEQSDVVHDLLAHLAGQMIEMHQQKQAEVKGFLDWLADYTGRPVDDWALKTNLRRYYEHDWAGPALSEVEGPALSEVEGMQRVLRCNQRKLPRVDLDVDAYRNEPAQKIRAAWETSMETLRPLLAHIVAADRLIDLIVYQLYGLMEEEVAIVEGSIT